VQPLSLGHEPQVPGDLAKVSGWGVIHQGKNKLSDTLRHVQVPIVSNEDCAKAYKNELIAPFMLCAGEKGKNFGQGTC